MRPIIGKKFRNRNDFTDVITITYRRPGGIYHYMPQPAGGQTRIGYLIRYKYLRRHYEEI